MNINISSMQCKFRTRNLAVYKRPIGATVNFDGFTEKPQERDIFSPSEKKSWERVHYPFAWLPSKYTSVAPIGLLYSAGFLVDRYLFASTT